MHEFELIARYLRPLARGFPGSLNLADDAALLDVPPGLELVVTADALHAGTHFIGNEDASLIARKALRVNLSDLAAKGAKPWCYFLMLSLPEDVKENWIARFASGLREDQETFGIALAGGDTTATRGPLSIAVTALGLVPQGAMLMRSGAKPGDGIYVSGTLGNAAEGLKLLQSPSPMPNAHPLIQRYLLPEPRITLGISLRRLATACMDISDGLAQDLSHLSAASDVSAELWADCVPRGAADIETALSGGDDYELLFTLTPSAVPPEGVTQVGVMTKGEGVTILKRRGGSSLRLTRLGYQHF